jgi:hypothetical protein
MGMLAAVTPQLPTWGGIAALAYFLYMLFARARNEERRRREEGQPHTTRDSALLLLTALRVVGVLFCGIFLKPLNVLVSPLGFAAVIVVVGGGLTYIFNRKRSSQS